METETTNGALAATSASRPTTVVFDVGGVLIDWNPRYLFRKIFDDEVVMEDFLACVCTPEWNHRQDEGRSFEAAVDELTQRFPDHADLIQIYHRRWDEMVTGALEGTVEVLARLRERGVPLYALTNFSTEKFPLMRERFGFFDWFDGIVVSGAVGIAKPDPRIYAHLFLACDLRPGDCLFIDDMPANVAAAKAAGMQAIQFTTSAALIEVLIAFGFLDDGAVF